MVNVFMNGCWMKWKLYQTHHQFFQIWKYRRVNWLTADWPCRDTELCRKIWMMKKCNLYLVAASFYLNNCCVGMCLLWGPPGWGVMIQTSSYLFNICFVYQLQFSLVDARLKVGLRHIHELTVIDNWMNALENFQNYCCTLSSYHVAFLYGS